MPFPTSTAEFPWQGAKPCKYGHTAGRDAANGTCKQCRRDAAKRRYHSNPETAQKIKERADRWRKDNPEKIRAKGQAYRKNNPKQTLLDSARDRARRDGYACTLTIDDIIVPEFCPLLGIKLEPGRGTGGARASSPSLDKINPKLGYVRGNVWVISYRANMIKNDATLAELKMLVERLEHALSD